MRQAKIRKSRAATYDRRLILNFLRALFLNDLDEPNRFGWGGLTHADWERVSRKNFVSLSGKIARLSTKKDVYFQTCTHDQSESGKRGSKSSVLLIPALYLDLDVFEKPSRKTNQNYAPKAKAKEFLLKGNCPLEPSIIIESGSGGFHAYWLFKKPVEFDEHLVKGWQELCRKHLGYDIDILPGGAAQLMRIPGTINHKYSKQVSCIRLDESLRYTPDDFMKCIGVPKTSSYKTSIIGKCTSSLRYSRDFKNCLDNVTLPLSKGDLAKIVHQPKVMLHLAQHVLGININPGELTQRSDSKSICCILPGHEEKNPSASLLWGKNDALIYQDFHCRDNKQSYSLTSVYASLFYKSVKANMTPTESATWLLRMLIDGQIFQPAKIEAIPLPESAPTSANRVYDGFILLMQCRGHYSPGTPAAFAWSFAQAWCQIPSKSTVSEGLKWLREHGYMVLAGEHQGQSRAMKLYELGTKNSIKK